MQHPEEEYISRNIIQKFKRELYYLEDEMGAFERFNGLTNETSLNHMKTLIESIKGKVIPSLNANKNIDDIAKVIYLLSCIYLEKNINPYRNDAQVILDKINIDDIKPTKNIFLDLFSQGVYSKNILIRFLSITLIVSIIIIAILGPIFYLLKLPINQSIASITVIIVTISVAFTTILEKRI